MYVRNYSLSKTTANSSSSMLAECCHVSLGDLDTNSVGLPSCTNATPRPLLEMSA